MKNLQEAYTNLPIDNRMEAIDILFLILLILISLIASFFMLNDHKIDRTNEKNRQIIKLFDTIENIISHLPFVIVLIIAITVIVFQLYTGVERDALNDVFLVSNEKNYSLTVEDDNTIIVHFERYNSQTFNDVLGTSGDIFIYDGSTGDYEIPNNKNDEVKKASKEYVEKLEKFYDKK